MTSPGAELEAHHSVGRRVMARNGYGTPRWTNCWIGLLSLALGLAACGRQDVATNATASTAALRWSETAAPQGVQVSRPQWLRIEGAGGRGSNVQVAAVLRPQRTGDFPLVVWFHGSDGLLAWEVPAARQLADGGFVVLVGCWKFTSAEVDVIRGISMPRIPCLENFASADDATRALVEVGQKLPGVRKGAIGLFGLSAGGPLALYYRDGSTRVGAVVVDSCSCFTGGFKVDAPVLMLGGTDDSLVPVRLQQEYEQTLRNLGTAVESYYYEGGRHVVTLPGELQADAIMRIVDFYQRHLK